jgi:peptidoglycan/xylan/chitin deacetylase (PgdA/CDA1 family)
MTVPTVPILLYHSVSDTPSPESAPFAVTPADFAAHMNAVVTRVSEYMDARESNTLAGRRIALITFDDGYLDFIQNALPILTKHKLPSTMYITTGWMNGIDSKEAGPSDPMMHMSQLNELQRSNVEIGAHSHAHLQMDTLGSAASRDEVRRPKELLEDTIGAPVRTFAYPHGYSSSRVRKQVAQAGYTSATSVRNAMSPADDDPFRLARLMLMSNTTPTTVESWLDGLGARTASTGESLMTIGWRTYRRAKAVLTGKPGSAYR